MTLNHHIAAFAMALLCAIMIAARPAAREPQILDRPEVVYPVHFDVSPPMHEMRAIPPDEAPSPELPRLGPPGGSVIPDAEGEPSLNGSIAQDFAAALVAMTPGFNFDGVGLGFSGPDGTFTPSTVPPDPNGAVGAYQYVHTVNSAYAIFSKATGGPTYGPAALNTLWQGFGGLCETQSGVDPLVLYDKLDNRWVFTRLVFDVAAGTYRQCIAVSATHNATGSYNLYAYDMPRLNDYGKLGIWPSAYFMSFNMFNCTLVNGKPYCPTYVGPRVCAFDRAKMVAGDPSAPSVCFDLNNPQDFSLLPSDLDGASLPPPGAPNYYLGKVDNTAALHFWRFAADFTVSPPVASWTGPLTIPITNIPDACFGTTDGICVPQPTPTPRLDSINKRIMSRLTYRNFGSYQSLVTNRSVVQNDGLGSRTGVRWYEIRLPNPNPTPAVWQEGTFAPDGSHRWAGSIAMDRQGNMAVGYSVSSASLAPSIRYTGCEYSPTPPCAMGAETTIQAGAGSQIRLPTPTPSDPTRWGDYTSMSVDPSFDCDFWYTNEYLPSNGYKNWKTRVASFRFSSCPTCVGDCSRDDQVTIDELVTMVNINLRNAGFDVTRCLRGDRNGDGWVRCNEINQGTNNALYDCPTGGAALVAGAATESGAVALASTVTQQIGSASGTRGSPVTIPVTVSGGAGIVSATQLDLLYPTAVLMNPSCVKASRLVNHSLSTSTPTTPPPPAGTARRATLVADLSTASAFTDGQIFSCTFTIKTTAPLGTHAITGELPAVSDSPGNELPSAVINGSVTVL